jgi:DNA-binding transcriptional MerR regulator
MDGTYRVQAFAALAGVTVRALHHYDRLALLRPHRSRSGYRIYGARELERLEQIVALKFLGLPLQQIKRVLDRDKRALPDVLRAQRKALEEKRYRLDQAIGAIRDAERAIVPGVPADAALIRRIIEVIEMQNEQEFFRKYYTDEAWAALEERRRAIGDELKTKAEEGTRKWMALFTDIVASLDADPASEAAQALAARWQALIDEFTGGVKGIEQGVGRVWADQANWPADMKQQAAPFADRRVWEFIRKAQSAARPVSDPAGGASQP